RNNRIEVVAMDGFTGFKTATGETLPGAVAVMDPFHVVRLAGDVLDDCRRRVQQQLHKRRGHKDDPLYKTRRTLHTGTKLLTARQCQRLSSLFEREKHLAVEVSWEIYPAMVTAYRESDRAKAKARMEKLIAALSKKVPDALPELAKLGRTLTKRAADALAFFDRTGTSNGPTEAINGRLEHLRGSALGFRNLTQYIARSLIEAGGFRATPSNAMSR
ncbi:ISL3 family transposase, partial [Brachybacterium sp. AOP42-E1-35]|uniref:ISL3 family transposase n=1 Tax=Brachybacterium sp. AOP42-E1-35 TaxID=3457664 RepID=UPI00402AB2AF